MSKPITYTSQTKCCIRCKHKSDHSHPDGHEIYCTVDGIPEPYPGDFRAIGFDEKFRKWCEWSVPRSVDVWGTCLRFEESAEVVEHERKMEESSNSKELMRKLGKPKPPVGRVVGW